MLTDVSVAELAIDFGENGMPPVGEKDMVGLLVDPFPQDFLFLSFEFPNFFLFGVLGEGILVTLETGGDFRQPGERLCFIKWMARLARQPLLQVFLVVEGNRLPGFEALAEGDEEEKQDNSETNSDEEEFHLFRSPNRQCLVLKDNNRRHKKITRKAADILFALRIPWGFGLPPE
jgi:hypothetical protein